MKYEDITIEDVDKLYNILGGDIVCDADRQTVTLNNDLTLDLDSIIYIIQNTYEIIKRIINKIAEIAIRIFNNIRKAIINLFNKRISKKRFIKLLQSKGIQRDDINKLIKNNKEKYTIWRVFRSIPPYFQDKNQKFFQHVTPYFALKKFPHQIL